VTAPQVQIIAVLLATVALFLWGRWRHDLVSLASLLTCVLLGVVPVEHAFSGFGHPAVITVACVLILSRGLQDTGAVDRVVHHVVPGGAGPVTGIAALAGLGAVLSAFMNNVGAMALLMPVALQLARRLDFPPSRMLMPLAFGTILGGMTTLIGTPPNLIVSGFRVEAGHGAFSMFAFTPVGASVALVGLVFVALVGWRLVPARQRRGAEEFDTGAYLAEVRVGERSGAIGKTLREAGVILEHEGAQIVGLVRDETRLHAPHAHRRIREGDSLIIEAEPEDLATALSSLGLSLGEPGTADDGQAKPVEQAEEPEERTKREALQELVLMPGSPLAGRSAAGIQMSSRHGLNLLAVSRQGQRTIRRVQSMRFKAGDLLLLQGSSEALGRFAGEHNLVPLASRDIRLPRPRQALGAAMILGLAIAVAAFGLLPAAASFALGALAVGVTGIIPARDLYKSVDWPVVVLLGALIPVAAAMSTTGTADLLADVLLNQVAHGAPVIAMILLLVVTMTLSDFMNNAATAAVMCPVALSSAAQLGVSADPLLMAVAIGASCAFLTPIGHQNNTLILGPGGLRFGDYWRLGLPMEVLVVAVSVPLLLVIWPL
jgi:di/tricarboxylate transporter